MVELQSNDSYTIIVVGCGGTGSNLVPFLMQLYSHCNKIKKVVLIDGDIVEAKNEANQKFIKSNVTKNKAQILAERYSMVYPGLKIEYLDDYLTSEKQLTDYMGWSNTILVGCVDNNATRKILCNVFNNKPYCNEIVHSDIVYIDSGNGTVTRNGQIIVGYKSGKNKILKCVGDIIQDIEEDKDDISTVGTCMRISNEHPQNLATNILAATMIFTVITNVLTFNKIESNLIYFNADNHTVVAR